MEQAGNIDGCFLYGFVVRMEAGRKYFSIAAESVNRAVDMALVYVEICVDIFIDESDVSTIVFLGRCDERETFKTEKWFFRDLGRRGCRPIIPKGIP